MSGRRFGTFELLPSERLLLDGGKPIELGGRAFDLLLVLTEHSGKLVSKSTLIERVWPRLVVDENNLPAQIASLRRILGAGAIRTVPGFGYRFEWPVSEAGSGAPPEPASRALQSEAPTLRIPRRVRPERLAAIVGREEDLRNVREALRHSTLVTLVGMTGVGKTRLAQEILARTSRESAESAAWVPLAPVTDPNHLASAMTIALGLSIPEGSDAFEAIAQALERVPLLLILDGAERMIDALLAPLERLIAGTESLRLLVTSQAPLGLVGETVYRLAALPVPPANTPSDAAAQYAAVELFAQRAAAADRHFALSPATTQLVAQVCRQLDGIPLALELAAARAPALGLQVLIERLDDRFRVLRSPGRTPDPRHGALQTAFEWSYELLSPAEQRVFNRLGAFAGSFTLKSAAHCVADDALDASEAIDLIGRLVDRSLVTALAVEPPRYTLLETARHYARAQLTARGELEGARVRMAQSMLEVLDTAYEEYWSLDEEIWLHRYVPELANVRAALDISTVHAPSLSVALFGSSWPLLVETDLHAEGRARYDQVLVGLSESLSHRQIARFWEAISTYEVVRQCDRARYASELAARRFADLDEPRAQYYALMQLASCWGVDAEAARAAVAAARALAQPSWPARLLAHGALSEGTLLMSAGDFLEARAAYRRAVQLALTTSERQALLATVAIVELDIAAGDGPAALQLARPLALSLRHLGRLDTRLDLLLLMFSALLLAGEVAEARAVGLELYELALRLDVGRLGGVLNAMALLAALEQKIPRFAARIALLADATDAARGLVRRRPVDERVRAALTARLNEQGLAAVVANGAPPSWPLDAASACAQALGIAAGEVSL
jgi:predicted ATPase/DNA-binding winged helix-turn-helix (wHTH) protein